MSDTTPIEEIEEFEAENEVEEQLLSDFSAWLAAPANVSALHAACPTFATGTHEARQAFLSAYAPFASFWQRLQEIADAVRRGWLYTHMTDMMMNSIINWIAAGAE